MLWIKAFVWLRSMRLARTCAATPCARVSSCSLGYLGRRLGRPGAKPPFSLVRRARPDDIGVSVSYPLPNTRFHQIVQTQLGRQIELGMTVGDLEI